VLRGQAILQSEADDLETNRGSAEHLIWAQQQRAAHHNKRRSKKQQRKTRQRRWVAQGLPVQVQLLFCKPCMSTAAVDCGQFSNETERLTDCIQRSDNDWCSKPPTGRVFLAYLAPVRTFILESCPLLVPLHAAQSRLLECLAGPPFLPLARQIPRDPRYYRLLPSPSLIQRTPLSSPSPTMLQQAVSAVPS